MAFVLCCAVMCCAVFGASKRTVNVLWCCATASAHTKSTRSCVISSVGRRFWPVDGVYLHGLIRCSSLFDWILTCCVVADGGRWPDCVDCASYVECRFACELDNWFDKIVSDVNENRRIATCSYNKRIFSKFFCIVYQLKWGNATCNMLHVTYARIAATLCWLHFIPSGW